MDFRDQLRVYLNTSFKKHIQESPYTGHSLVKFGEWSRKTGFVKQDAVSFETLAVPCPVIAIVDTKIRESNLTLTITAKNVDTKDTETFNQIGREITKQRYEPGSTTVQTTWEVPRFTRQYATFLVSGLGNQVYEITDITSNVTEDEPCGGKISFYGLASEGSKILYYLGMDKIHNMIKQIVNSIWIAPTQCPCCNGTGYVNGSDCPQCDTYGYSGYNAEKGIQIDKGYDVRITREKYSTYPLTDAQNDVVWKFVNKAWTQKWWVTPTPSEIKRLFAHFYNVDEEDIILEERFHFSMPHWDIRLPVAGAKGSPFGTVTLDDRKLFKFIAQSVTPAGVNVFVGFYKFIEAGDFEGLDCRCIESQQGNNLITNKILYSSMGDYVGSMWRQRYRVWNGWNEAVDSFESGVIGSNWNTTGVVDVLNVNDQGRHWCRLSGNSHIETTSGFSPSDSGYVEMWVHPQGTNMKYGGYEGSWGFYTEFRDSGFYDHYGTLIRAASRDCDYHLKMRFDIGSTVVNEIYINRELVASGVSFLNPLTSNFEMRIASAGTGYGFFDCFGGNWMSGYAVGDNWQRLYPFGWGQQHDNFLLPSDPEHYKATYSFTCDTAGSGLPSGFIIEDTYATPTTSIVQNLDNHELVFQISCGGQGGGAQQIWPSSKTVGTVEFWAKTSFDNNVFGREARFGAYKDNWWNGRGFFVYFYNNGYIRDWNGTNLVAYSANTWYHVKIYFNIPEGYGRIKINGIQYGGDISPPASTPYVDKLLKIVRFGGTVWSDAIGYGWDEKYHTGQNKYPVPGQSNLYNGIFRKDKFFNASGYSCAQQTK